MSAELTRPAPVVRYDRVAMTLHWLVASLILINIVFGLAGANAPKGLDRPIVNMHKSIGITLLGLVLLRILWRLGRTPPPLPPVYPRWERVLAHGAHASIYFVILALPITGYIHDSAWKDAPANPFVFFGVADFPRIAALQALDPATKERVHSIFAAMHVYLGYALYVLVALHLLGVAKHHAIDHQEELQRMLPKPARRPDPAE